jgi:isoamylase
LGAHVTSDGFNFAAFSTHATRMVLCLFDTSSTGLEQIKLPTHRGYIWHGHVADFMGLRTKGPMRPITTTVSTTTSSCLTLMPARSLA